jgi:uncharacterized membrane protein YidH (DUF202 family)
MSAPLEDEGRGAQLERTMLAWNRSAIALAANGALLMRAGFLHNVVALEAFGLLVALGGLLLWALSLARYSKVAGQQVSHLFGAGGKAVPGFAAFMLLLTAVTLVVVVFDR